MSLLRVFVAIELPASVRGEIHKQTSALRQHLGGEFIRWVPAQNMHLTLKFLGDTAVSHFDFLRQMLSRETALHPPFEVQIGGVGCFPNQRTPRVLWVAVHAPSELTSLQRGIEAGAARLGYKPEARPFSPHLTIGRARENASLSEMQKIRAALGTTQPGNIITARVEAVHLFKSDLQPGGSVYTKLFSASLSKP